MCRILLNLAEKKVLKDSRNGPSCFFDSSLARDWFSWTSKFFAVSERVEFDGEVLETLIRCLKGVF